MSMLLVETVPTGIAGVVYWFIETIKSLFAGIGSSIVDFFNKIVIGTDGNLTTFAIWTIVFMAFSFVMTFVWMLLRKVG